MRFASVVLPPPDGPTSAIVSPGHNRRTADIEIRISNVLEVDLAAGAVDDDNAGIGLRLLVEHMEHTFGGGKPALEVLVDLGQPLQWRQKHGHCGHERYKSAHSRVCRT